MLQDVIKLFCPFYEGLVFSEYLLSGQIPSVKEVNDEEPLFFNLSLGASRKVSQGYFQYCITDQFFLPTLYSQLLSLKAPLFNIA